MGRKCSVQHGINVTLMLYIRLRLGSHRVFLGNKQLLYSIVTQINIHEMKVINTCEFQQ